MRFVSLFLALVASTALALSAAELRMIGSTTMFSLVVKDYKDQVAKETGTTITATGATTAKGFAALVSGQADVTLSADALENVIAAAKTAGISANAEDFKVVFVKDSFLDVIVNKANPLSSITEDQARGILSGQIKRWSELGGPDLSIAIVFEWPESANHRLVKTQLLKDTPLSPRVITVNNARLVSKGVAEVESGFGISARYFNNDVKTLQGYAISQPLSFIVKKDASPETLKVLEAFIAKTK